MKRWNVFSFFFFLAICFSACDSENTGQNATDEYYVKYEVNSTSIYTGGKLNATINTENNKEVTIGINARTQWETVIGPVKKGFNASLNVNSLSEHYGHLRLYTQISVSKNGSPFALKKIDGSDTPRTSVQINYTIDY